MRSKDGPSQLWYLFYRYLRCSERLPSQMPQILKAWGWKSQTCAWTTWVSCLWARRDPASRYSAAIWLLYCWCLSPSRLAWTCEGIGCLLAGLLRLDSPRWCLPQLALTSDVRQTFFLEQWRPSQAPEARNGDTWVYFTLWHCMSLRLVLRSLARSFAKSLCKCSRVDLSSRWSSYCWLDQVVRPRNWHWCSHWETDHPARCCFVLLAALSSGWRPGYQSSDSSPVTSHQSWAAGTIAQCQCTLQAAWTLFQSYRLIGMLTGRVAAQSRLPPFALLSTISRMKGRSCHELH